jgi:cobalt/nickel transport system ATP-binding protein
VDEKAVESARGLLWLRRKLGVVFQDPDVALFNPTVWKEVAFGPLHLDVPEKEVIHRTERALADMGISHLKDRAPHRLSEGEKRKVSIASVLSIRPDIILFDEPTAGLDPRSRKMIIRLLGRLSGQGKTVIVATHDLEVVPSFAERMVVVNRRVLACGMSRDILSDTRILDEAGLEAPAVARLFAILKENGFPVERLPFSPEEGAEILMGDGMVPGERGKLPGPK